MKNLNAKVFLHGLIIAIVTPIIPALVATLNQGSMPTIHQLEVCGIMGLSAGLSYIGKVLVFGSSTPPAAIIALLLMLSTTACQAQQGSLQQMYGIRGTAGDTIKNTGTAYDSLLMGNAYAAGSIVTTITKISGTVSPTILIQASVDGYHWVTFGQDTVVLSNATGTVSHTWQLPGLPQKSGTTGSTVYQMTPSVLPFLYYRIFATGTGTMQAIIKSWFAAR